MVEVPYTNDSILMCDNATLRGLPRSSFRIVCDCGKDRKFVFTKESWDIFPCPYCFASGVMSNAKVSGVPSADCRFDKGHEMKTVEEMIAVMQHFANSGKVEAKPIGNYEWGEANHPVWDWDDFDYRIVKPEPKQVKLEAWIDHNMELRYRTPCNAISHHWKRVPNLDLVGEVEE